MQIKPMTGMTYLIRMIQSCVKSKALPLKLLFKTILEEGIFPKDWKKRNAVPVHKKVFFFFFIVLNSEIILVTSFRKLNQ